MKVIVIREVIALIMRPSGSTAPSSLSSTQPSSKPLIHTKLSEEKSTKKSAPGKKAQEKGTWNTHARYYGAITFNQIVLSTTEEDRKAARILIELYFDLFRDVIGEYSTVEQAEAEAGGGDGDKGEEDGGVSKAKRSKGLREKAAKDVIGRAGDGAKSSKGKTKEALGAAGFAEVQDENSRLVSAILTGINRALPYARIDNNDVACVLTFVLVLASHMVTYKHRTDFSAILTHSS